MPVPEPMAELHLRLVEAWTKQVEKAMRLENTDPPRRARCVRLAWMYAALVLTIQGDDITPCLPKRWMA